MPRRFQFRQRSGELGVQKLGAGVALCVLALVAEIAPAASHSTGSGSFPGVQWTQVKKPEDAGWSSDKLTIARKYAATLDTAAVVIVDDGVIVDQWGDTGRKFNVHSIRKSFLNALYGIAVAKGQIRLGSTLQDLGIDDNEPSLTPLEKQARVIDLLKARSGIYHPALYESAGSKARRPVRGSHPPRSFWYYNNWDFNALGTIYEHQTGTSLFKSFAEQIATPLQMQDFQSTDTEYVRGPDSVHPAYPFRMTARDMARFGLLYLRMGGWRGQQIVPQSWVAESTIAYSVADGDAHYGYSGYGCLWWVAVNGNHFPNVELPDGTFSAWGSGGHFIVVVPDMNVVVVHRVDTDIDGKEVSLADFGKLLGLILDAKTPKTPAGLP